MEEFIEKIKAYVINYTDIAIKFMSEKIYKPIKEKVKKFTAAELLVLVLVAGIAIVAILPTIRLIVRGFAPRTGVFKCYYDENGVLMQENSADKNYKTPKPAKNGVCVFKMIDTSKMLEITLIGGGGGGSASQIAENQRDNRFNAPSKEIDLLADELEFTNPFNPNDVSDSQYSDKVLSKISLTVTGGGGGSTRNANVASGMGGICIIKDLSVGDKVFRKSGKNGIDGQNGTDGTMVYESQKNGKISLTAFGGKGTLFINQGDIKDGSCSDSKYSAGKYRNESSNGIKANEAKNQAFYNNFLVSKIIIDDQTEKIRALKGSSGSAGESITFKANNLEGTLKICSSDSKEDCHAYIGHGGQGALVKNKNAIMYSDNLSGKNGEDTKFLNKIAKGGRGGNSDASSFVYLEENSLALNGENAKTVNNTALLNSGGNCEQGNCNAKNSLDYGASGGGGGLLYETTVPFQNTLSAKIFDSQNRQIGATINFAEIKSTNYSSDLRHMGNGGNGGSGAIIIRW